MTRSSFLDLVPMLMCADVRASVRFYCDVLGFEVVDRMDDVGATGFASLRNGAAQIMLASPTYVPRAPTVEGRYPQAAYYFYVEDAGRAESGGRGCRMASDRMRGPVLRATRVRGGRPRGSRAAVRAGPRSGAEGRSRRSGESGDLTKWQTAGVGLPRWQTTEGAIQGQGSSKYNRDCTICRTRR